jgi:8-oxo-dGTP diphosphatase
MWLFRLSLHCLRRRIAESRDCGVQVVAGIIEREGRILICRRKADQSHPLKWEFPGGKVEHDESLPDALARELNEDRLIFLRVIKFEGEPRNRIFEDMRWESRQALAGFDFVEGDVEFLRGLESGAY